MSELFTSYMNKVSTTVMTWHSRILPICNKMSSCGYDKFHTHSATIQKMTNEYFAEVCILKEDLEKELQKQMEEEKTSQGQVAKSGISKKLKSQDNPNSGSPGKSDTWPMIQDELDLETLAVLNDIEKSSTNFIDDACKSIVSHIRTIELLSYLGQIFALSLNFKTSIWQLVLMESIFPIIMNRVSTCSRKPLHFTKLLPEVNLCVVHPPPLPTAPTAQASVSILASMTSNPYEGASITNPDNPPDESHHVPLPQMPGVVQTPSVSVATPKVSTPQVSTPQMSAAQASIPQTSMPAVSVLNFATFITYRTMPMHRGAYTRWMIFLQGAIPSKFIEVLQCTQLKEKFHFAKGQQEKKFHFQYLFHCFYDENNRLFPPSDLWHHTQSMGLGTLHSACALSCKKVFIPLDAIEFIFCPH